MRLRDTRRGQAMVEMAMLLPVLLLLFLGAWTAANLIDDNNSAAQATRAGARLAAELGNAGWPNNTATGCQATKADPCQIDKDIIDQVLPIVSPQLTNAKVIEIDIYQPNGCIGITPFAAGTCPPNNGAYCTSCVCERVDAGLRRRHRVDRHIHRRRQLVADPCRDVHLHPELSRPDTSEPRLSSVSGSCSRTRRQPCRSSPRQIPNTPLCGLRRHREDDHETSTEPAQPALRKGSGDGDLRARLGPAVRRRRPLR